MQNVREFDKEGKVHSIWTFGTPFIGAICNCDMKYCIAMRASYKLKMPAMFKGENIASIDTEKCIGCGECENLCQLKAINSVQTVFSVDEEKCIGCGTCRSVCEEKAIALGSRKTF